MEPPPRRAAGLPLLLLSVGLLLPGGGGQHLLLLRPIPSDSLPLLELREDPDPVLDPGERDLNETELRSVLGDFDARFLSVSPPEEDEESEESEPLLDPGGVLQKETRSADPEAPPGWRQRPNRKLLRRLQLWLRALSSCPLRRAWTDLGGRFWPRYVRAGVCPSKRSCSVPEGMRCRPAGSAHLTVLRWRCAQRRAGLRCAWIPVQYPVITDCKCSCSP
ncbi:noggin-like [Salarias fasciatus]|uniref:noggin-like n=1 Tax=Salarias fasciatus TaxID=181472 RepID=UPI0011764EAE|nr:noggin-like [Salarias fasciatus]